MEQKHAQIYSRDPNAPFLDLNSLGEHDNNDIRLVYKGQAAAANKYMYMYSFINDIVLNRKRLGSKCKARSSGESWTAGCYKTVLDIVRLRSQVCW